MYYMTFAVGLKRLTCSSDISTSRNGDGSFCPVDALLRLAIWHMCLKCPSALNRGISSFPFGWSWNDKTPWSMSVAAV